MQDFSLGDLVIIELSLANYIKGLDLSMYAGQQVANIIGKVEYNIANITDAAKAQFGNPLEDLPPEPNAEK